MQTTSKRIRAGLIGAGRMGIRHFENLFERNIDVVGIADAQPAALEALQARFSVPRSILFSDAVEMINRIRPELLIVSSTAPAHADLTCHAAEVGCTHILCEKPMATSVADARRMIDTCKRFNVCLAINHQMRFMDQYTVTKRMLESEQFGGVTSIHVTAGNFGLAMNGCHYAEMLRFITGSPVVEVQAWFSPEKVPNPRGIQFEDRGGCMRLVTASGVRFSLDASVDQGHGVWVNFAAREGLIFVDELSGKMMWTARMPEHRGLPTTRYGVSRDDGTRDTSPADARLSSLQVMDALLAGEGYPSGEDGLAAMQCLVAAHMSDADGHRIVRIEETISDRQTFPWA